MSTTEGNGTSFRSVATNQSKWQSDCKTYKKFVKFIGISPVHKLGFNSNASCQKKVILEQCQTEIKILDRDDGASPILPALGTFLYIL